jgi:hypothetical protein
MCSVLLWNTNILKNYCNMFCPLKTPFGLLTGLFNNLPVVTTITDNTVMVLHTLQTLLTNLFTLFSVVFTYSQRGSYPSPIELHTPNITVPQYSQVLKSHSRSSLAGFFSYRAPLNLLTMCLVLLSEFAIHY